MTKPSSAAHALVCSLFSEFAEKMTVRERALMADAAIAERDKRLAEFLCQIGLANSKSFWRARLAEFREQEEE